MKNGTVRKLQAIMASVMLSVSVNAQSSWTQGTNVIYSNPANTKIGVGITSPTELLHINGGALKIGNSSAEADRAINMLKIGDGSYKLKFS